MKERIVSYLGLILSLSLLGYTASRTLELIEATLPADKRMVGWLALAALEGGLLVWSLIYLHAARGGPQRAIAMMMICVDLLGVVVSFVASTFYDAAANGLVAKGDMSIAIWGFSAAIAANVCAFTFYHILSPENRAAAARAEAKSRIEEQALAMVEARSDTVAAKIAPVMADRFEAEMTVQFLGAPVDRIVPLPRSRQTITPPAADSSIEVVEPKN